MQTPQDQLDAVRARGHALLGTARQDGDVLDEESHFTIGDLRVLLDATNAVWLGHEIPHRHSNVR